MGKGDPRTKRGKIWRGSYGKARSQQTAETKPAAPAKKGR